MERKSSEDGDNRQEQKSQGHGLLWLIMVIAIALIWRAWRGHILAAEWWNQW